MKFLFDGNLFEDVLFILVFNENKVALKIVVKSMRNDLGLESLLFFSF